MVLFFLTMFCFDSWAGAAVLNLVGILVDFGLLADVTIPGEVAELSAAVVET